MFAACSPLQCIQRVTNLHRVSGGGGGGSTHTLAQNRHGRFVLSLLLAHDVCKEAREAANTAIRGGGGVKGLGRASGFREENCGCREVDH